MTSHPSPPSSTAQPAPPESEVRRAYEPVEIRHDDGSWTVGRINGWWRSPDGTSWCRLRSTGEPAPHWVVFDPARHSLLPTSGT